MEPIEDIIGDFDWKSNSNTLHASHTRAPEKQTEGRKDGG